MVYGKFYMYIWKRSPKTAKIPLNLISEGLKCPPGLQVEHKTCSTICGTPVQAICHCTFHSLFINYWPIHSSTHMCEHDNKCKHKDIYKYRKTEIISSPPVVFVSSSIRFLIAFWDSFSFSSSSLRSAGNILIKILLKIFWQSNVKVIKWIFSSLNFLQKRFWLVPR